MSDRGEVPNAWNLVGEMLTRPYPLRGRVAGPIIALLVLVPFYLVITAVTAGRTQHVPELALDRWLPVQPVWAPVYASHLVFVFLPVLLIRQEELIRRTFLGYVLVWSVGYVCFLAYPTGAGRPGEVAGNDFFAWSLRAVYAADPPRNCFPSLHVAHAFVSVLACGRVHRGVGLGAGLWAGLMALSTLFTKQHYVADVIAGIVLAGVAYAVFLRNCPREVVSESDRRVAPILLLGLVGVYALVVAGFWAAHRLGGFG